MLVILPCAGGSSFNYKKLQFDDSVKIYEYAGHWTRAEDDLDVDFEHLVSKFVDEITPKLNNGSISMFGHSMGAIVALSSVKLFQRKEIKVTHLYVSACGSLQKTCNIFNNIIDDDNIIRFLSDVRQVPLKVLSSVFFAENLLPAIRNDFKLLGEFSKNCIELDKVNVPITCLCGQNDPLVSADDMSYWHKYTISSFEMYEFPGDHFFVNRKDNIDQIIRIIRKDKM